MYLGVCFVLNASYIIYIVQPPPLSTITALGQKNMNYIVNRSDRGRAILVHAYFLRTNFNTPVANPEGM